MSEKKITPERFLELQRERVTKLGKPEEKGLPLIDPSPSLVNGTANTSATTDSTGNTESTNQNSTEDRGKQS